MMELSNVLNKLTQRETPEKEYLLALQVWQGGVKSAIWTIEEGKVRVAALGGQEIWEETAEDLVNAADRSLATASSRFTEEGKEPTKIIFGLPYDWVEGEKILPSWQKSLRVLCEELEFSPVGFVLTVDAINHHLKNLEGIPPSVILVSPQKDQVLVAVIQRGTVKRVEQVSRSENLAADVYEGLSRLEESESLPSRMVLFNGEDMEEARQILIEFPWQSKLSFLHLPKIEILPLDFDITSICLAGGSEVAKSLGFKTTETEEPQEKKEDLIPAFGFVYSKDIREEPGEQEELPRGDEEVKEEAPESKEPEPVASKKAFFPSFSWPQLPGMSLGIFLAVVGLLVLGAGFLGLIWFLPKAQVILYVSPKSLEKEFALTVDPNQEVVDKENFLLPGRIVETEVSGEKEESTTGKKTVGEKTKGEVTIFNTAGSRRLNAGTILTGPGGLKFTLDEDVAVGSGSAVDREEVKTMVTATEIGADYNLAADSEFGLANLDKSVIGAKNNSTFTGGTSRQIQAVSEEDQKRLLNLLNEELEGKGKIALLEEITGEQKVIEDSVSLKEVSRRFDHQIGDEAQDLRLSLKVKVSVLVLKEEDLFGLIEEKIKDSIPEGYEAKKEQIQSQLKMERREKDGSIACQVFISLNLLPKLRIEEIMKNIKGKQQTIARDYLGKIPGVVSSEIVINPKLLERISILPRNEKNIQLEVRSQ